MGAQPHNRFVFCVVVAEFAVNGNQVLRVNKDPCQMDKVDVRVLRLDKTKKIHACLIFNAIISIMQIKIKVGGSTVNLYESLLFTNFT